MDAITLLKTDHKNVKDLFKQVEGLSERAAVARRRLCEQIAQELEAHAQAEEQIFYPALRERTKRNSEQYDLIFESVEEHAIVKQLIAQLRELDPKDDRYKAKMTVMQELVEEHVKEEEREMFPAAKQMFESDELKQLGNRMAAMKEGAAAAV
ncbi:MAG: hemerythrin domain-containing protein [Candidatus Velthaea sp.]